MAADNLDNFDEELKKIDSIVKIDICAWKVDVQNQKGSLYAQLKKTIDSGELPQFNCIKCNGKDTACSVYVNYKEVRKSRKF